MRFNELSVIICCYNSSKKIINTLKCLSAQNGLNQMTAWEIIIIDNNSTDNTASISKSYWESIKSSVPLKVIKEQKPGKSNALIRGYDEAKYELIVLCDDDNWLQPKYLARVLELFNKYPSIGMLGGYGERAYLGANIEEPKWFTRNKNLYVIGNHIGKSGFLKQGQSDIWGAGSVIRKSMWIFLRENGFDFKNSKVRGRAQAEDSELSFAISLTGHLLYFDGQLTFIHDLSGGRITKNGMYDQIKLNANNSGWLMHYNVLVKMAKYKKPNLYVFYYMRLWFRLLKSISTCAMHVFIKPLEGTREYNYSKSLPYLLYLIYLLISLVKNFKKYKRNAKVDYSLILRLINSYPLIRIGD